MNEVPIRLLRETLQARAPAGPSHECLDAETVAAWADDTLGPEERRAAEAHAADCVWCQAWLAAMATTAPQTTTRSWWRAPVMGWLVPLTAAAAALLVWMNVPRTALVPSSTIMPRVIKPEPPRPAVDALSNTRPQTPDKDNSVPPRARQDAAKVNGARATDAARGRVQTSTAGESRNEAPAALAKALSEAGGGAAAPASFRTLTATPATASPTPQRAAADALTATVPEPPLSVQRTAAPLGSAQSLAFGLNTPRSTRLIVSSSPGSQWRILANGVVQHSTDSGSTWEVQSTGVTVMLTAGASPAPSICWLVGPEGTVLLTTDGRSWRHITFPETVDLASVLATDDKRATVNSSDGRAFSTTDGGQTWTR